MVKQIILFALSFLALQSVAMPQPHRQWVKEAALIHIKTSDRNTSFRIGITDTTTVEDLKQSLEMHHKIPGNAQIVSPSYANPWFLWLIDKVGAAQPNSTNVKYLMNHYNTNRLMLTLSTLIQVPDRYRSIYTQKK